MDIREPQATDGATVSTAYRLAVSESNRLVIKYYDVPQVFVTKVGLYRVTDLTLKNLSSGFKSCNNFFDVIQHVECNHSMAEIADVLALDETEDPTPAGFPAQLKPRGMLNDSMKHQVVVVREEDSGGMVTIIHHYEVRGRSRITLDRMRMLSWGKLLLWNYVNYGSATRERVVLQLILARLTGAKKLCGDVTMNDVNDKKLPVNVFHAWRDRKSVV